MHQDALPVLRGSIAHAVYVWDAAGSASVPSLCSGELFLAVSFCKVTMPACWDVKLGKTNGQKEVNHDLPCEFLQSSETTVAAGKSKFNHVRERGENQRENDTGSSDA